MIGSDIRAALKLLGAKPCAECEWRAEALDLLDERGELTVLSFLWAWFLPWEVLGLYGKATNGGKEDNRAEKG